MKNLIKAEWLKLSKSSVFKVLLFINLTAAILYMCTFPRTGYRGFRFGIAYCFYHTNIALIFTVAFLCEDFSNKSFGKSLLSGYSRKKIFWAKVIIFWLGMVLLLSSFTCSTTITSSLLNGFGMDLNMENCKNILFFIFCGILGCTSISSVMILFSTTIKSKIPTIMVFYLVFFPIEYLKNNYRFYENGDDILKFLKCTYVYQVNILYQNEDGIEFGFQPGIFFLVHIVTIIVTLVISLIIFEKTEFK